LSDVESPCIIILSAPSGSGKTTVAKHLMEEISSISFSVSATTRPARDHEVDGKHYHFLSVDAFQKAIAEDLLLEYEEVYTDCFYGTLRSEVESSSAQHPVLLDIDVVGAVNVKQQYSNRCLALFIRPPSIDELKRRLQERGTETEAFLKERIDKAEYEMTFAKHFDHIVTNGVLSDAVAEVVSLVRGFIEQE